MAKKPDKPIPAITVVSGSGQEATGAWPIEGGWSLLLTMKTSEGIAQVEMCSIEFFASEDEIRREALRRCSDVARRSRPSSGFRYLWVRGIQQQYEAALRDVLTGQTVRLSPALRSRLGKDFGTRPPRLRAKRGDEFYAAIAARFVALDGSIKALSADQHVAYSTAKEWVAKATRSGFLNEPGKGKRGARQLTSAAQEVLDGKR